MRILVAVAAILMVGACAKQDRNPARRSAAPATPPLGSWAGELIELLPAESQVVIGVDLARIREAPLLRQLTAYLESKPEYLALAASCKLGPHGLIDHVVFGTGFGDHGQALIAEGHFDAESFAPCVEQVLTAKGPLTTEDHQGHKLYLTQGRRQAEVLAFSGAHRILYGEHDWVVAILDGVRPRPALLARVGELDAGRPGFYLLARVGSGDSMPSYATGAFDLDDRLVSDLTVHYATAAGASHFVEQIAQAQTMLSSMMKLSPSKSGDTARLHLEMTAAQLVDFGTHFLMPRPRGGIRGPLGIRSTSPVPGAWRMIAG